MSAAEWIDTYVIQHWRILRSSYRKLAWVGFQPMVCWILFTRSKQLSYQAMSSTSSQSQLCKATPVSSFCSVFAFDFDHDFISGHVCLKQNLAQVIIWVQRNELIYIVFTNERFWELAIESRLELGLKLRPLNSL